MIYCFQDWTCHCSFEHKKQSHTYIHTDALSQCAWNELWTVSLIVCLGEWKSASYFSLLQAWCACGTQPYIVIKRVVKDCCFWWPRAYFLMAVDYHMKTALNTHCISPWCMRTQTHTEPLCRMKERCVAADPAEGQGAWLWLNSLSFSWSGCYILVWS